MQTIQIDGLKFDGPYVLGRDELPNVPAIALIITEAGEGFKIMSVLHGFNIKEEINMRITTSSTSTSIWMICLNRKERITGSDVSRRGRMSSSAMRLQRSLMIGDFN